MIEEQGIGLVIQFRYLTWVLDAYGKHYPKADHFIRQLQLLFLVEYRQNATSLSKVVFGLQLVRGWGYILAQDRQSPLFPLS